MEIPFGHIDTVYIKFRLHTCVCVCVCVSIKTHAVISTFKNFCLMHFSKKSIIINIIIFYLLLLSPPNEKCYFSSISWPILILFVLSDRAGWGLQNFYTKFWNVLIMQIYSKSTKNATSLFLGPFWFGLFYLIGLGAGFKTSTQNLENH